MTIEQDKLVEELGFYAHEWAADKPLLAECCAKAVRTIESQASLLNIAREALDLRVKAVGRNVLLDGDHLALASSAEAAFVIAWCLNTARATPTRSASKSFSRDPSAIIGTITMTLKPCPFCGDEIRIVPLLGSEEEQVGVHPGTPFVDGCLMSGCSIGPDIWERWNTRAMHQAMTLTPEMIEAGVAALRESGVLAQQRYEQGIVSEVYTAMHRAAPAGIVEQLASEDRLWFRSFLRGLESNNAHRWTREASDNAERLFKECQADSLAALTVLLPLIDESTDAS
jgi:hypothetical protein